jgi:predicted phosphodiesterase
MKKLLSFLILFCFLFACDNADSSQKDESLSGKVTAKITVEKTKFLPTETVTFNGDTSVFVDGAVQAKVYEWAVVNEAGENVDFTNNGSSITLTETKAGKYQASLIVKQANLTSQVAKKTIYRIDSETVYVRVKVQPPTGTDAMYLAHTNGIAKESGNPIDIRKTPGIEWAAYATLLQERDATTGEYLYKDGDFFYRDYIVEAATLFEVQPTQGSWGSKARRGNGSSDFKYSITPCSGTAENPRVIELIGVTTSTSNDNEFHWGFNTGDITTVERKPLLVFTEEANSYKLLWNTPATNKVVFGEKDTAGTELTAEEDTVDGKTSGYCATFANLEPGKTYYYKFADDDYVYFNTPKATDFTFVACSDHQTDNTNIKAGAMAIAEKNPDFVVSCGDICNDGYSTGDWKSRFFELFVPNIAGLPFAAAPGNHDGWNLFADVLGQENRYHSFVYGNTRFIMLDVEAAYTPDTQQYKWLEEILKNDTSTWKIVALHESPYCCVPTHYSNLLVRDNLVPLFEKYGVNLVIGGHMHAYDRTKTVNGVQYVTLPCLGASPSGGTVNTDEDFYHKHDLGKMGFALITVSDEAISVKVQTNAGAAIDSFSIDKSGNVTE